MIYMDNAATTRLHPEVINAMLPYMGKRYANPSGAYTFSADVKNDINNAEAFLAQTIQAKPQEIYITSEQNRTTGRSKLQLRNTAGDTLLQQQWNIMQF